MRDTATFRFKKINLQLSSVLVPSCLPPSSSLCQKKETHTRKNTADKAKACISGSSFGQEQAGWWRVSRMLWLDFWLSSQHSPGNNPFSSGGKANTSNIKEDDILVEEVASWAQTAERAQVHHCEAKGEQGNWVILRQTCEYWQYFPQRSIGTQIAVYSKFQKCTSWRDSSRSEFSHGNLHSEEGIHSTRLALWTRCDFFLGNLLFSRVYSLLTKREVA